MNSEIEQLIELYDNKDTRRQRVEEMAIQNAAPDVAEVIKRQSKLKIGKDRQRAELLKQNEVFLAELKAIRDRLGEKFFSLFNTDAKYLYSSEAREVILKSDFAEPQIVISKWEASDISVYGENVYYLPGVKTDSSGDPESYIDLEHDPFFDGPPLEWIIVKDYEIESEAIDVSSQSFRDKCKEEVFERYLFKWYGFLDRWHIDSLWYGDLESLYFHSRPSVVVEQDFKNHNMPVVIKIGAWATREDVGNAWERVEEKMKDARVYRERESENFLRDQIWYKQSKDLGMTPLQIAREWAKRFPKEIDLEVIEKLTRDEETFMDVPPQEVLEEVLSDDKLAELKGRLTEARKAYISTGLRDRVKKSLQATQKKIKRLGSENWDRNRERLLKPVLKKPEK